jgi:hypothetical protein
VLCCIGLQVFAIAVPATLPFGIPEPPLLHMHMHQASNQGRPHHLAEAAVGLGFCAAAGVTMVATIHSPTAYSFSLFDSLMMLVRGRCGHIEMHCTLHCAAFCCK